ncbi:MAG: FABP family protein, partial [Opitutaceae bacterium]|nr:FABP family protein [Opitutaceae bacterium]
MTDMPPDIYTEPDADSDTLRNLGPLIPMAGSWLGDNGLD